MDPARLGGETQTDPELDLDAANWGSGLGFGYGRTIEKQFRLVEREIIIAADRGKISSKEECWLLHQLADIDICFDASRQRGLNGNEHKAIVKNLHKILCYIGSDDPPAFSSGWDDGFPAV